VYGADLISREDSDGNMSVYHFDRRGSTVALTDTDGNITDRYAYDPYGRIRNRSGSTQNRFTYCGSSGVVQDCNGLYCMRGRYYDPILMRFIQKDQMNSGKLNNPQTLNRYAYARGNPITFTDPRGQSAIVDFFKGEGFLYDLIVHGEFDSQAFAEMGAETMVSTIATALIGTMVTVLSGAPIIGLCVFAVTAALEAIFDIDIGKAIVNGLEKAGEWIVNAFSDIMDWFSGAWNDVSNWFSGAWNDVSNWFSNDFVNFWVEDVGGFFEDVGSAICDFFNWLF